MMMMMMMMMMRGEERRGEERRRDEGRREATTLSSYSVEESSMILGEHPKHDGKNCHLKRAMSEGYYIRCYVRGIILDIRDVTAEVSCQFGQEMCRCW